MLIFSYLLYIFKIKLFNVRINWVVKVDKKNVRDFGFGTQIRKSPFFNSTVKWGATGFSVYNHMYIPRDFGSPEENFWNLINNANYWSRCFKICAIANRS